MIESNDGPLINEVIRSLTRENERLVEQLVQLQYYFRGAYTRDDIYALTPYERSVAAEFLNNRFKEAGELLKNKIQVFL